MAFIPNGMPPAAMPAAPAKKPVAKKKKGKPKTPQAQPAWAGIAGKMLAGGGSKAGPGAC